MNQRILVLLLTLAVLGGCASGPKVRIDVDPSADFAAYKTYGFMQDLGTDKAGYSTLVTGHFKKAIQREMDARGYTLTSANPDLLVNFSANVVERETTRVTNDPATISYYNYRFGYYNVFPTYSTSTETVTYNEGTVNVDVVDAAAKQLLWEGIAEGRVKRKAMSNPAEAISRVIDLLFEEFPVPE